MSCKSSNMSLLIAIKTTIIAVRSVSTLAALIYDSKILNAELIDAVKNLLTDLDLAENILNNLARFAQRVSGQSVNFLHRNIELLKSAANDANLILEEVQRDRNVVQRVFMSKKYYKEKLRETSNHLNNIRGTIHETLSTINLIEIPRREFPDFRTMFQNKPENDVLSYDLLTIRDTFNSVISMNFEDFNPETYLCYFKMVGQQIFLSYHLRIWSDLHSKPADVTPQQLNDSNLTDNIPAANAVSSRKTISFMEFFKSHDPICGMALTKSMIYVATRREIKVFSLKIQETIAQHDVNDNGSYLFDCISYIYIPPDDETNLYILDSDQNIVHQYRIDDSGLCFEFVRPYIVIANVNQKYKLISCVIFNRHLYISDEANNCLHIFPLNGDRQSIYLADISMTPFSPGALCTHGGYLYVADCSKVSPGILILNERCEPVDWFCNRSLTEILAIDIDLTTNQLCLLTSMTTRNTDNAMKKRPTIVSMDLAIRTE